jgi:hypothetical protein
MPKLKSWELQSVNMVTAVLLLNCFALPQLEAQAGEDRTAVSQASETPLCQLFKDLPSHTGRTIVVSGIVEASKEVFALRAPDCPYRFRTGELSWPPAVSIRASATLPLEESDRLMALGDRVRLTRAPISLRVTLRGKLRMREKYEVRGTARRPIGNGFGHLNMFPAEFETDRIVAIDNVGGER